MWVRIFLSIPFILLGTAMVAQAMGLGRFIGRTTEPDLVIGIVGALFLSAGLALIMKAFGEESSGNRGKRILRSTEEHDGIFQTWLGSLFFLGMIGVFDYLFLFKGGGEAPPFAWAVLGLFTLVGLGGVFVGVRKTLEWFKYGSILLYLDALPQTGAALGARLKVPDRLRPARSVTVKFSCMAKESRFNEEKNLISTSDLPVWSETKQFPIQWSGASGQVQLQFAIPASAPATNLPVNGHQEFNRVYHRWELSLSAEVPGIDLDRIFELHMARGKGPLATGPLEIAPRGSAPAAFATQRNSRQPPAVAAPGGMKPAASQMGSRAAPIAPLRGPSVMIETSEIPNSWKRPARFIAAIVGTVVLAWFFGLNKFFQPLITGHKNTWPAAVAGPFEMKPDQFQQALRLFSSGVTLERHGADIRVRVEKLRMVKVKASETVEYTELGAYLTHMPQGGQPREIGKWRDIDYRGTLVAGKAEDTIGPIEFSFNGNASACAGGDCWLKLFVNVPSAHRYENTGMARFLFSQTTQIGAAIGGARTWEGWLERAQQAGWAGRADEARRSFEEGIAFVQSKHGETSAMHALMLLRYSEFLRRQSQRDEEQKRLAQAVEIFSALDDTTIAAQIGTDWGQGSAMQEFAPRRLADMYASQGRHEEALALYRSALAVIRRLGTKVSRYVLHLRSAENQIGIGASLCSQGRADEAGQELTAARGSATLAEKLMEARWKDLFNSMQASQSSTHRPNYVRDKAEHAARAKRIDAVEERIQARACGR